MTAALARMGLIEDLGEDVRIAQRMQLHVEAAAASSAAPKAGSTPPPPPPRTAKASAATPLLHDQLSELALGPKVITDAGSVLAAVNWLASTSRSQDVPIGVDTEGDLRQGGAISLVQARCSYRTYIFDLHTMRAADRQASAKQLARLLEDEEIIKVMHDCRRDAEALFYLHGIRCRGLWDTQVAHGLTQLFQGLGGKGGLDRPVGLNAALTACGLPPNPLKTAMHARMNKERDLFTRRPLDAQVFKYSAADVQDLGELYAAQRGELGAAGAAAVLKLSLAYSEWYLKDPDRSWAVQGAYRSAAQLPTGCDLQMAIAPPTYLPKMSLPPFLEREEDAGPASQAEGAAGQEEDPDVATVLSSLFPASIQEDMHALFRRGRRQRDLVEVVVDSGRPVVARFANGDEEDLEATLGIEEALACLAAAKGVEPGGPKSLFGADNRTGIPHTLYRISALRGRDKEVLGLTYRIGRHVPGVAARIGDILASLSVRSPGAAAIDEITGIPESPGRPGDSGLGLGAPSLLLLGPPGVGKTTLLRDVAGMLADTFRKRVIVVDTSNEIAGDGAVPHACIGRARRMQVTDRSHQHYTLIEAVQNHNPQAIVVDEIGSAAEVAAAKSIAQRGVVMVGTAHGTSLEGLLLNPELNSLVGGVHQVLLGDMEAKASNAGVKTRTERKGAPAFSTLVEVVKYGVWRVHHSVARSVDDILAGRKPTTQLRWVRPDGVMMVRREGSEAGPEGFMKKVLDRVGEREAEAAAKPSDWLAHLLNLAAMY